MISAKSLEKFAREGERTSSFKMSVVLFFESGKRDWTMEMQESLYRHKFPCFATHTVHAPDVRPSDVSVRSRNLQLLCFLSFRSTNRAYVINLRHTSGKGNCGSLEQNAARSSSPSKPLKFSASSRFQLFQDVDFLQSDRNRLSKLSATLILRGSSN